METRTTESGETLYISRENAERGSKGPFWVVYRSQDQEARYGYYCSNCETLNNAMDPMGRIVCNDCGNTKKPDEWDAAHE